MSSHLKNWATSLGNFYLYSNLHIGLCALFFCVEYASLVGNPIDYSYFIFIGASTVTLYLLHRYIGLGKVNAAGSINSRYLSISKAVPYYPYLGVVFGGISLFFFIQIGLEILTTLSLPLIVSLLYVIPFLPHGKRLRDISYLKIFLIALTWTWFSVWYLIGDIENNLLMLITLEHFIFMLGITLPFDVRDIKIDQADNVSTFATLLGKSNAKITTTLLLTISLILTLLILYTLGSVWLPYLLYSLLYIGMIVLVNINVLYQRDVYLTGVLDGTILLKGLIGWLFVI